MRRAGLPLVEQEEVRKKKCDKSIKPGSYGCSKTKWKGKSYCWKACDQEDGHWGWVALKGGEGNWKSCSSNDDCKPNPDEGIGANCPKKKSHICGCGCG